MVQEGEFAFMMKEEAEVVSIVSGNASKVTLVAKGLSAKQREGVISCLTKNRDVFACPP